MPLQLFAYVGNLGHASAVRDAGTVGETHFEFRRFFLAGQLSTGRAAARESTFFCFSYSSSFSFQRMSLCGRLCRSAIVKPDHSRVSRRLDFPLAQNVDFRISHCSFAAATAERRLYVPRLRHQYSRRRGLIEKQAKSLIHDGNSV